MIVATACITRLSQIQTRSIAQKHLSLGWGQVQLVATHGIMKDDKTNLQFCQHISLVFAVWQHKMHVVPVLNTILYQHIATQLVPVIWQPIPKAWARQNTITPSSMPQVCTVYSNIILQVPSSHWTSHSEPLQWKNIVTPPNMLSCISHSWINSKVLLWEYSKKTKPPTCKQLENDTYSLWFLTCHPSVIEIADSPQGIFGMLDVEGLPRVYKCQLQVN